jgi:hypothetical protein
MPATGTTYTQRTDFGVSNGPTYSGVSIVPATVTGTETFRNYSAQCLNSAVTTIDAIGFTQANLLAFGFIMGVDPVQTGAPTPAQLAAAHVTVHLKDCDGGIADYDVPLVVGQSSSFVSIPATLTNDCTSITVDGDAVVDCCVYGLILLSA